MAVSVTKSEIVAFNTIATLTPNLATADTDGLAEVFTITPTKKDGKCLLIFDFSNLLAADAAGADATFSIAAGAACNGAAVTGTITRATRKIIQLETQKVLSSSGTIVVTITPGASDKLLTNHAAAVMFVQLL